MVCQQATVPRAPQTQPAGTGCMAHTALGQGNHKEDTQHFTVRSLVFYFQRVKTNQLSGKDPADTNQLK